MSRLGTLRSFLPYKIVGAQKRIVSVSLKIRNHFIMQSNGASSDEGCLLAVIIDLHPQLGQEEGRIRKYLDSIIAFINLHLSDSASNRIAVFGANHAETKFLYPRPVDAMDTRQVDGRLEILSHVNEVIEEETLKMLSTCSTFIQTESLIAGALGRALLYIKRLENEDALGKKIRARILIVKTSSDSGGQYLNYINMYLTAQKMGTVIDMCVLGDDSGLLQQGADITGGYYFRVNNINELLQTLLMFFSPSKELRKKLNFPPPPPVDYRAACFCHRSLVDMAHVCSNCLSVYCKSVPFCSTCNVFFRVEMPVRKPVRKKK